jgi:hypothetical protein
MLKLYDEQNVYYIGHENRPRPFVGYTSRSSAPAPAD